MTDPAPPVQPDGSVSDRDAAAPSGPRNRTPCSPAPHSPVRQTAPDTVHLPAVLLTHQTLREQLTEIMQIQKRRKMDTACGRRACRIRLNMEPVPDVVLRGVHPRMTGRKDFRLGRNTARRPDGITFAASGGLTFVAQIRRPIRASRLIHFVGVMTARVMADRRERQPETVSRRQTCFRYASRRSHGSSVSRSPKITSCAITQHSSFMPQPRTVISKRSSCVSTPAVSRSTPYGTSAPRPQRGRSALLTHRKLACILVRLAQRGIDECLAHQRVVLHPQPFGDQIRQEAFECGL